MSSVYPPLPRGTLIELVCERCGNAFIRLACEITRGRGRFCSRECQREPRLTLTCGHCGGNFEMLACQTTGGRAQFCSKACRFAARSTEIDVTCAECGVSFRRAAAEVPQRAAYCSRLCAKAARQRGAKSYPKIGSRHAHRVVAEHVIGRPLLPGEIVHHKDDNKRNYAPDNLQVLPNQSAHAKIHFSRPRKKRVS